VCNLGWVNSHYWPKCHLEPFPWIKICSLFTHINTNQTNVMSLRDRNIVTGRCCTTNGFLPMSYPR
jgi:hypothetical protein